MFGAANHRNTDHRVGNYCDFLHGLHGYFICILDVTHVEVCACHRMYMCVNMFSYIRYAQAGCLSVCLCMFMHRQVLYAAVCVYTVYYCVCVLKICSYVYGGVHV